MYKILKATKDTYVTDKIINNDFRATDANVGQAGTLDLFKLYNESTLTGTDKPSELTRILIKFDLDPLRDLTGSVLDLGDSSFKCTLKMTDVYGGQTTPSNFKVILFPLSQSFDEGTGLDVVSFEDLDACNMITASYSGDTAVAWFASGANQLGHLGQNDIDIIASGNLDDGEGLQNIFKTQLFESGEGDLSIDVTTIVSATIVGKLPDHGFRLSYSGTHETNDRTLFVKRFASRHSSNTRIRPRIVVQYDDSVQDDHENFYFDMSGSLFLNNYDNRGKPANLLSGAYGAEVKGNNAVILKLTSGSYTTSITGSQHKIGSTFITGVYSATFALSSWASTAIRREVLQSNSATFNLFWESSDYTMGYHTGSLVIKQTDRTSFNNVPKILNVSVTNMKMSYQKSEKVRFRIYVADAAPTIKAVKLPRERPSLIFREMFYRVKDANTDDVVIPFDTTKMSTRLSTDALGMYFDLYMDSLDLGRVHSFDFLIKDQGSDLTFLDVGAKFRVDP